MRVRWLVAGLLSGACALPAWALDFAEAFRLAKDYDARVKIAGSRAAQDEAGVDVARSRLLPQVSAAAARGKQYTHTNYLSGPYPSRYEEPDTKNWVLQVRQGIYRPAEWRSWDRAQSLAEASARGMEAETATLLSRVAKAYLALLEARTQLKVAEQDVARYTEVLRQAQRAFETGQGTRIEIEEAQARLDSAQASVVDWQGQIETGRQDLAALIGQEVKPEELTPFTEVRGLARDMLQEPVTAWVERTMLQNPELASLKAQLDAAEKQVAVQKAGHLPTVDAVASRTFSRSDSVTTIGEEYLSTNVAVQVSIPLYSGGGVNASVRAALAAREESGAIRRSAARVGHRHDECLFSGALRFGAGDGARSGDAFGGTGARGHPQGSAGGDAQQRGCPQRGAGSGQGTNAVGERGLRAFGFDRGVMGSHR